MRQGCSLGNQVSAPSPTGSSHPSQITDTAPGRRSHSKALHAFQTYTPPMFRRACATVFWLLLLALPLQGWAGGMKQRCDAMSMPASATHSSEDESAIDVDASFDRLASVGLGAVGCAGSDAGADHSSSHCAGSAACGFAAAYGVVMPSLPHPAAADAPRAPRGVARFGFLTGAPERPPRQLA